MKPFNPTIEQIIDRSTVTFDLPDSIKDNIKSFLTETPKLKTDTLILREPIFDAEFGIEQEIEERRSHLGCCIARALTDCFHEFTHDNESSYRKYCEKIPLGTTPLQMFQDYNPTNSDMVFKTHHKSLRYTSTTRDPLYLVNVKVFFISNLEDDISHITFLKSTNSVPWQKRREDLSPDLLFVRKLNNSYYGLDPFELPDGKYSNMPTGAFSKIKYTMNEMIPTTIEVQELFVIPEFTLIAHGDESYTLSETRVDEDSISISGLGLQYSLSKSQISTIQHDLPLAYFCEVRESDVEIHKVFGEMGDRNLDLCTPDISCNSPTSEFIYDMGTTRNPHGSEYAFYKKINKYIDIAKSRTINLKVTAVSVSEVTHNVNLTPRDCKILCSRFMYGREIQRRAEELGWSEEVDDDDLPTMVERSIQEVPELEDTDDFMKNDSAVYNTKPINLSYMDKYMVDAQEEFRVELNTKDDHQALVNDFIDETNEIGTRDDCKSVSPTCLFSLKKNRQMSTPIITRSDDMYPTFWTNVLSDYVEESGKNYNECKDFTMTHTEEKEIRNIAKDRHVYNLEPDSSLDLALSSCGVQGKKFSKEVQKTEKEAMSREPFKFEVDTSDIDKFINSFDSLMEHEKNPLNERFRYLLKYAKRMKFSSDLTKTILNTKLGSMLTTFTAIMCEINVNARKKMKGRQWSVVKHPSLPCFIAIHTSRANSHVFYSILFHKDDLMSSIDKPFRKLINLDEDYMCTPICSLLTHDLSIWISMPNLLLSTISVFSDIYDHDLLKDGLDIPCKSEVMFCLLEALENKDSTSSPTFNARYMYMEMLKPKGTRCNPFKVLKKYPIILRSRLLLWNVKHLIKNFMKMTELRSIDGENIPTISEDTSEIPDAIDNIPNILSYISGNIIPNFGIAINLSYIGVFHNVDKGEALHGYLKIFSKVIKEEKKLRHTRGEYMVDHSNDEPLPSEYQSHEFSPNHMRNIARRTRKYLKKRGIYRKDIRKQIFRNLSKISFSELSTFKASANSENFEVDNDPVWMDYVQKKRNKALEEVITLMDSIDFNSKTPYTSIVRLLEALDASGGIIANLFKKSQPTGVREIFVLTMISRIVTKILESISRTICEMLDNEYLTKGNRKATASTAHQSNVKSKKNVGDVSYTVSDSCDATTWCQRFIMNVFQCFFNEFFSDDKDILKLITRILNKVTDKRLELPKQLLDLFEKMPGESSYDENMNDLKDQFLGLVNETDLIDPFHMLMKNRSNFMQGILHYTSSLVHASHLLWFEEVVESMFVKTFKNDLEKVKIITKTKASSDDSSRQSTVIVDRSVSENMGLRGKIRQFLLFSSSMLIASYPLFCAQMSREKSTTHILINIEEFNSSWTVVNTVVTPRIKWAMSSQMIQTTSSTSERQNVDHGLLNDLVKNGCRRTTTQQCEIGCALNHYSILGFYTLEDEFFHDLFEEIFELESTMAGFYLLSHGIIGTSFGFNFTKWFNLTTSENCRKSENVSMKHSFGLPQEDGSLDFSLTLPIGFGKNYYEFLEKLGVDKDMVDDLIENKEHILFGESNDVEDEKVKVILKSLSIGASKAFSFSSSSKQHSVSAYINTVPCLNGRSQDSLMKYTLPSALELIRTNHDEEYHPDEIMYPQMRLYQSVIDLTSNHIYVPSRRRRRKLLLKITIPNLSRVSQVSLLKCIQRKWFNMEVYAAKFVIELSFAKYKTKYPWLMNSFQESFDKYNEDYAEIDKYIFSQHLTNLSTNDKTVEFHHQGKYKSMLEDQLADCFGMNYRVGFVSKHVNAINFASLPNDLQDHLEETESRLAELANSPPLEMRKTLMLSNCMMSEEMDIASQYEIDIRSLNDRLVPLYVIKKLTTFYNRSLSQDETNDALTLLSLANQGILAFYIQKQKRDKRGKFQGLAILIGLCNGARFRLTIRDDILLKIECDNPTVLQSNKFEFRKFISKLRLKLQTTDTHDGIVLDSTMSLLRKGDGMLVDRVHRVRLEKLPDLMLRLEVNYRNGISLKFESGDLTGDTITYYPKHIKRSNIIIDDCPQIDHWLRNEPISLDMIEPLLSGRCRAWTIYTMKLRFEQLGLFRTSLPTVEWDEDEIEETNKDEYEFITFDPDFIDSTFLEFDFKPVGLSEIMDAEEEINEVIESAGENIRMFDDDFQAVEPRTHDLARRTDSMNKRFWDGYIDRIRGFIDTKTNSINMSSFGNKNKSILKEIGFAEQTLAPYADDVLLL